MELSFCLTQRNMSQKKKNTHQGSKENHEVRDLFARVLESGENVSHCLVASQNVFSLHSHS